MTEITHSNCVAFLKRFAMFCDSVIRSVAVDCNSNGTRTVDLVIAVPDESSDGSQGDWVCVHINVTGVSDYRFEESRKQARNVVSQGIQIAWYDDHIGIDLDDRMAPAANADDLTTSRFFTLGSSASWEVIDYLS